MTNIVIKERIVFLLGFGAGFCITLLIYLMKYSIIPYCDNVMITNQRTSVDYNNIIGLSKDSVKFYVWLKESSETLDENHSYEKWLQMQNTRITELDMDSQKYDNKSVKQIIESKWLMKNVHVTCVIFVEKLKLAETIANTWGKHCNKLLFFGKDLHDFNLPVIKFDNIKFTSSWQLLCESMNYIWNETKENLEWIIFVKDDTMVIPENLRYIVAPLNYEHDYYLGHAVSLWGQNYNVAEAGYVLSKSAFEKIVKKFDNSQKCASSGKFWKKEDFYLGKHLRSMGIKPSDTRDSLQRGTFHGYSLQILFWGIAKPGQYWTRALYPPGDDCCSTRSVTFNAVDSSKMYTLNYLLYNFNTFLKPGIHGNKSPARVKHDDEVWKKVLKDEFGIENITEISNEQYYQLWRKKYSEPETFMENKIYNPLSSSSKDSTKR
ncbi:glycoprotein-N-acetylgalactosamine 3-beta-galactosyltransferase 1-like [Leptopilina boulardi]|uniref:glycoprotein-N-acetylgalactosamine 3-beta-galactosyltransferase 1-like n=1 Tax=Leptopilina boulardi TaxID=63433 RepID=UPI0021F68419|nr:glycoprotein-N-acetylgalactosamine 3-beta-galactosyltransferase 1-like [Leptopilina boulardi]